MREPDKPPQTACDVAIIGGGVAGSSCALALAREGALAIIIEGESTVRWKIGETLGPESRPVLQSLGVWEEFTCAGHLPCHGNASAWEWDGLAEKDFILNPHGNARQLDRVVFEEMLASAAEKSGAVICRGQMVEDIERNDNLWTVKFGDNTISAKWLVDATGRRSMFARKVKVKREILDQLVAIYNVVVSLAGTDQDSRTFIESCPDGWWYSALTPGGRRTVSFQTDADLLLRQEWRTQEWFAKRLGQTRHVSTLLGGHGYVSTGPPQLTSAHSGRLEQFSGDGWLAIGDAAMSFDPLSGQGILKAMQSGLKATEVVTSGQPESRTAFEQWNEGLWGQFIRSRTNYYEVVQRWPHSPFWQRRDNAVAKPS